MVSQNFNLHGTSLIRKRLVAWLKHMWVMVFNTTFNNISVISWHSVLLVKETQRKPL